MPIETLIKADEARNQFGVAFFRWLEEFRPELSRPELFEETKRQLKITHLGGGVGLVSEDDLRKAYQAAIDQYAATHSRGWDLQGEDAEDVLTKSQPSQFTIEERKRHRFD